MVDKTMGSNIRGWDCGKLVGVDLKEDRRNLTVPQSFDRLGIEQVYV